MSYLDDYIARINDIGATSSDYYKNMQQDIVNNGFEDSPTLVTGKLNGVNLRFRVSAFFNRKTLTMNPDSYQKVIFKDIQQAINIGDILEFNDLVWICTETTTSTLACSCLVTRSNNVLKFYSNSVLSTVPCFVGKGNISLSIDKFISLASDEYIISCPNTADSSNIDLNTRFILSGSAYKVLGVDAISNVGLLDVRIKEDLIVVDDNLELGIANYYSHQHTYAVLILNGSTALFRQNETLQLNVNVSDNSILISPTPIITYSSSNINICTVSTTGLITGVSVGGCTISVSYGAVTSSIAITVNAVVYDNITVSITGATTVKLNNSITLTSSILNNGIVDGTKTVLWSISNQDLSSNVYLSVTSQTGNSIVLKATSNSSYVNKYIVIRATESDNFSKFFDFTVQIKSLL